MIARATAQRGRDNRGRAAGQAARALLALACILSPAGCSRSVYQCARPSPMHLPETPVARPENPTSPESFETPRAHDTGEEVCLSLRALVREAEIASSSGRDIREEAKNLAGIGRLEAFLVDKETGDVVLVGRRNPRRPNVHLDDLVVNLRAVWRGEPDPYCSLDPRPQDVAGVNSLLLAAGGVATLAEMRQLFGRLRATWGHQRVVVGGTPRGCRQAHVMVEADYDMKKVSLGLERIPGIRSYLDEVIEDARRSLRKGGQVPAVRASISRFWFHLDEGHPTFKESEGIVWLDRCAVILLTEKQMASATGRLYDSGGEDACARAFASRFSDSFQQAAALDSTYADLENLFRLRALLKGMRFRRALAEAGLSLDFLVNGYRCTQERPMPEALPGVTNAREATETVAAGNMIYQYVFFPMACGGVSMEIRVTGALFTRDATARLEQLRVAALKAKPHPDALCWTVPNR